MLELFFAILLQLAVAQTNANKPAATDKTASDKNTTITTNKASTTSPTTGIGSGGWDPNN